MPFVCRPWRRWNVHKGSMKWPTVYKTIERPQTPMEQGTVVLSLDVELLWGYLDILDEHRFSARYPNAMAAYDHVLRSLCNSGVSATWMVVGGMALNSFEGPEDGRVRGLPDAWRRMIPAGNEITAPLWFQRAFIRQVMNAQVPQDIGLHGGFSHLIWTDKHSARGAVRAELSTGMSALHDLGVQPRAFSFPRNMERYHSLLAESGIRCYRGCPPNLSEKLGRSVTGNVLRLIDEAGRTCPQLITPQQKLPGLWNIPASLYLYPIGESRSRIVAHQTRLDRLQKGIDAAAAQRGIFHFCLDPVSLAESPRGYGLFDSIVERLAQARQNGDIEIVTMAEVANRLDALTECAGDGAPEAAPLPEQMIGAGQY